MDAAPFFLADSLEVVGGVTQFNVGEFEDQHLRREFGKAIARAQQDPSTTGHGHPLRSDPVRLTPALEARF
jgi:hypothetical protein